MRLREGTDEDTGGAWGTSLAAIALLTLLILLRLLDPGLLETFRLKWFDFYQEVTQDQAPRSQKDFGPLIVDIDDDSLANHGQWPWPRGLLAELVWRLVDAKAGIIAFDMVFPEPDGHSSDAFISLHKDIDPTAADYLRSLPSNDRLLAGSFVGRPVVLGLALSGQSGTDVDPLPEAVPLANPDGLVPGSLLDYPGLIGNIPILSAGAAGQAVISLAPDRDGLLRRVALLVEVEGRVYPALALEVARLAEGGQALSLKRDSAGGLALSLRGERPILTGTFAEIWPRLAGTDAIPRISAGDILSDRADLSALAGRAIVVGSSATGLANHVPTALGRPLPSLVVQARMIESLLAPPALRPDLLLQRPSYAKALEVLMVLFSGLLIIFARRRLRLPGLLALTFGLAVFLLVFSVMAYGQESLLIDASFPLLALALVFTMVVSAELFLAERHRRLQARQAAIQEEAWSRRLRALQGDLVRQAGVTAAGQLSSALAHELNQPLAATYNFIAAARRFAERREDAAAAAKLDEALAKAAAQTQRGSDILKGIREVVEGGEITAEPVDLTAVVAESLALAREMGVMEGIQVSAPGLEGPQSVLANAVQLHQVLTNLLQNAADAVADCSQPRIALDLRLLEDQRIELSVSDNGGGIDVADRETLFRPFVTRKAKGLGLGLPICRAIVEAHGGRLVIGDSTLGGASFSFSLPLIEPAGPAARTS